MHISKIPHKAESFNHLTAGRDVDPMNTERNAGVRELEVRRIQTHDHDSDALQGIAKCCWLPDIDKTSLCACLEIRGTPCRASFVTPADQETRSKFVCQQTCHARPNATVAADDENAVR